MPERIRQQLGSPQVEMFSVLGKPKLDSQRPCVIIPQNAERLLPERPAEHVVFSRQCYPEAMYAQKFQVDVWIRGERRACPLEWLDQFSMRNFTNSADFDDTLPVGEGKLEASFRLTPERFAEGLAAWLTQRGKGEGQPVQVEVKVL